MVIFNAVKLFTTPWLIVRHKSKPIIQKTRIPHWEKLKVLETCKPILKPDTRTPSEKCELALNKLKPIKELTAFETLLGKELLRYLDSSNLVGIFHANSIKERARSAILKLLIKNNMKMGIYNRFIVNRMLAGTKYEAIAQLFVSHCIFVFSNEPTVDVLLKLQKKMPQYILLAGIFENRIMSRQDLEWYGSLPTLEVMHGQLYATLNVCSTQMIQQLGHHQLQLSHSLSLLAKPNETDEVKPPIVVDP